VLCHCLQLWHLTCHYWQLWHLTFHYWQLWHLACHYWQLWHTWRVTTDSCDTWRVTTDSCDIWHVTIDICDTWRVTTDSCDTRHLLSNRKDMWPIKTYASYPQSFFSGTTGGRTTGGRKPGRKGWPRFTYTWEVMAEQRDITDDWRCNSSADEDSSPTELDNDVWDEHTPTSGQNSLTTRRWANVQHDGRPAEFTIRYDTMDYINVRPKADE